jgi:hypothetical protein
MKEQRLLILSLSDSARAVNGRLEEGWQVVPGSLKLQVLQGTGPGALVGCLVVVIEREKEHEPR